jgi:hypothetical protein
LAILGKGAYTSGVAADGSMIVANWNHRTVPAIENAGFLLRRSTAMYQTESKLRLRLVSLESSGFECAFIVESREDVARQIFLVRFVTAGETVAMIVQDEGSFKIKSTKVASIGVEDPADVFDFVLPFFGSRPDSPNRLRSLGLHEFASECDR